MFDNFRDRSLGSTAPAVGAFAIVPSDSTDLPAAARAVTIGTAAGSISYIDREGQTHTTGPLPIGTYPFFAYRVLATGTTATGLTGWV